MWTHREDQHGSRHSTRWAPAAALALILAMVSLTAAPAHADVGTCPTASAAYSGGSGAAGDPYLIATPGDWQRLRDTPADWGAAGTVTYFAMNTDIDMGGCEWTTTIGDGTTNAFIDLDGRSHTLSGLNVTITGTTGTIYAGLFGVLGSGSAVRSLTYTGNVQAGTAATTGTIYAGGIVGDASGTDPVPIIDHVTTTGTLTTTSPGAGSNYAGGVSGRNGHITAATTSGALTANGRAGWFGGLVGQLNAGSISGSRSSSTVTGNLTGTTNGGGLVGRLAGSSTGSVSLRDSAATGNVSAFASMSYSINVGGIVGSCETYAAVSSSSASGAVYVEGDGEKWAGGAVGSINGCPADNLVARGSVTVKHLTNRLRRAAYAGGLVGMINSAQLTNSYATGVPTSSGSYYSRVGGLTASPGASPVTQGLFWDTTTSGTLSPYGITGATGLPTADMYKFASYTTATAANPTPWDMANGYEATPTHVWGICDKNSYPFLRALTPTNPCGPPPATLNCTIKGTAGNDIINVAVADGRAVVVCTGLGTDTIRINSITDPTNPNTRLLIAMGNGTKTVEWNAGNIDFNTDTITSGNRSQFVITRPDANPDIIWTGTLPDTGTANVQCGTNVLYQQVSNGTNLTINSGAADILHTSTATPNPAAC